MSISYGTIRRRYEQGLDSIVRLVTGLEDRIEELTAMHVSAPQIWFHWNSLDRFSLFPS